MNKYFVIINESERNPYGECFKCILDKCLCRICSVSKCITLIYTYVDV